MNDVAKTLTLKPLIAARTPFALSYPVGAGTGAGAAILVQANLRSLGHTKCARPIFPLDANVSFIPKAKLFQRHHS